ncbi:BTAD domain-containing putative transcriptional regulator [Amycolatopsis sp. cg5]|uniref:AfsR/SARP family transcriptional regulator n=1 Tax=Amycolatopsis sp. cg5 TaxID=3238802 RepID=UPI0035260FCE
MDFRLLGEFEAPVDVGHARQRDVLVALLVSVNQAVSLDQLADRVWGDRLPSSPRDSLYSYLSRLRTALASHDVSIRRQGGGYLLEADPTNIDLHRFEHLVERAHTVEHALPLLDEALALWRGVPFTWADSPWFAEVRESLERRRLAAELDRNDLRLKVGRHLEVIDDLTARIADSVDERMAAQLILALHLDGRHADALRRYEEVRAKLAEELGTDPGPRLKELHQRILAADTPVAPRQLPAAPIAFTGRTAELDAVPKSGISVITGGGGLGKTWLALRWAHDNAAHFPDGQLYLNLRGFDPAGEPLDPATAVRGLLDALGVAPAAVPAGLDSRAALLRSMTAGRRMLIVLDNARETTQVLPLLPSGSCTVLVTSRSQLTGLVTGHAAHPITLRTLDDTIGRELLARRLGSARVAAEPDAIQEILRYCAGLPLALSVVAARAALQPGFPLHALATELAESGLDALDGGELPSSLRAVFACSYRALDEDVARAFRLLGIAPGPDIAAKSATVLIGGSSPIRALTAANLLEEHAPGRFRMHDLVRRYAAELAGRTDTAADRDAALTRLFDYYVHAAAVAMDCWAPQETYRRPPLRNPVEPPPAFADQQRAADWLDTETPVLLAISSPSHLSRLSTTIFRFLDTRARFHEALDLHTKAVAATEPGEVAHGWALSCRGYTLYRLGRYEEALADAEPARLLGKQHEDDVLENSALSALSQLNERRGRLEEALALAREGLAVARRSGHELLEGIALNNLGFHHETLGQYTEAAECLDRSGAIALRLGNGGLGGIVLCELGHVHARQGRFDEAVAALRQSLDFARLLRNPGLEAEVCNEFGETTAAMSDWDRSLEYHGKALKVAREIGYRHEEGRALLGLAQAHQRLGDLSRQHSNAEQALALFTALEAPEAGLARSLTGPASPSDGRDIRAG